MLDTDSRPTIRSAAQLSELYSSIPYVGTTFTGHVPLNKPDTDIISPTLGCFISDYRDECSINGTMDGLKLPSIIYSPNSPGILCYISSLR